MSYEPTNSSQASEMTSSAGIGSETEPSASSVPRASVATALEMSGVIAALPLIDPAETGRSVLAESVTIALAATVTIVLVVTERIDPRDAMTSQTKERGNASKKGVRSAPLLHEMSTDVPSAPPRLAPRASLVKNVEGCGQTTASSTEMKKGESAQGPAASRPYSPLAVKARTRSNYIIQRPLIAN